MCVSRPKDILNAFMAVAVNSCPGAAVIHVLNRSGQLMPAKVINRPPRFTEQAPLSGLIDN